MAEEIPPEMLEETLNLIWEIKHRVPSEKYDEFIRAMRQFHGEPESPEETVRIVGRVLEGQRDLIQRVNGILPERLRIPIDDDDDSGVAAAEEEGCTAAVDLVNRIGMRDRGLLKTVLMILDSYNKGEIGEDELRREVVELLKGDPELLDGVGKFLPVTEATPISVVAPQKPKPYSRKFEDLGGQKEEQRVSKRAKSGNGSNPQREELFELILENREKLTPSTLYRYSTAAAGDAAGFREEIRSTLFPSKPPATVANEKERRRVSNKVAETETETETEEEEETETPTSESIKLTPSYRMLPPEKESSSSPSSILNTTCKSVASEDCHFKPGAGTRLRRWVDSKEERLNQMEDALYESDMAKRYLMSAVEYVEGEKEGNVMGKNHLKRCLQAMYGKEAGKEIEEKDQKLLDRVVKRRLYQKIGELNVYRLKLTAKRYLRL